MGILTDILAMLTGQQQQGGALTQPQGQRVPTPTPRPGAQQQQPYIPGSPPQASKMNFMSQLGTTLMANHGKPTTTGMLSGLDTNMENTRRHNATTHANQMKRYDAAEARNRAEHAARGKAQQTDMNLQRAIKGFGRSHPNIAQGLSDGVFDLKTARQMAVTDFSNISKAKHKVAGAGIARAPRVAKSIMYVDGTTMSIMSDASRVVTDNGGVVVTDPTKMKNLLGGAVQSVVDHAGNKRNAKEIAVVNNAEAKAANKAMGKAKVDLAMKPRIEEQVVLAKDRAEATTSLPMITARYNTTKKNVDELVNSNVLDIAIGTVKGQVPDWLGGLVSNDFADVRARFNQVHGEAFLSALNIALKGSGQVTEIEGKKGTEALLRAKTAISVSDFKEALKDYQDAMDAIYAAQHERTGTPVVVDQATYERLGAGEKFLAIDPATGKRVLKTKGQ